MGNLELSKKNNSMLISDEDDAVVFSDNTVASNPNKSNDRSSLKKQDDRSNYIKLDDDLDEEDYSKNNIGKINTKIDDLHIKLDDTNVGLIPVSAKVINDKATFEKYSFTIDKNNDLDEEKKPNISSSVKKENLIKIEDIEKEEKTKEIEKDELKEEIKPANSGVKPGLALDIKPDLPKINQIEDKKDTLKPEEKTGVLTLNENKDLLRVNQNEVKKEESRGEIKPIDNEVKPETLILDIKPELPKINPGIDQPTVIKEEAKEEIKPIDDEVKPETLILDIKPELPKINPGIGQPTVIKEEARDEIKPIDNEVKPETLILDIKPDLPKMNSEINQSEVKKEEIKPIAGEAKPETLVLDTTPNIPETTQSEKKEDTEAVLMDTNTNDKNETDDSIILEESDEKEDNLDSNNNAISSDNSQEDYLDKLLDDKISSMTSSKNVYGVGRVTKIKDYILEVTGLEEVSFFEKVNIANKEYGYVMKLESNYVIVSLLSNSGNVHIGDEVYSTNEEFMGEYSESAMGRIVDIFGRDKLSNKKFTDTIKLHLEDEPVPIMDRRDVNRPLETGIIGIDLIYPIGKGQRQLIIGDKKTGKTQICLDTIVNQRGKNELCIYVAVGKSKKEVKDIYYELLKRDAASYTIIITAFYDDMPPILYLTPYFALAVANYYMQKGMDVLVCIDDLKRHADAYREMSLLSGKSPGRDAYPADIFYSHSRLLEKGCQYKNGASVTVLPIVETKGEDITDYISTNIISITDGQIVLSRKNFKKGEKPAINYGLSVSRLGGAVQTPEMKKLGAKVRQQLLSYLETRDVYELANIDEIGAELQARLFKGQRILEQLRQYKFSPKNIDEIKERFAFIEEKQDV